MKFSKSWLQDYIVETLPDNSTIEDALNKKAFEVEGIESFVGDTIFDIKVLPNRHGDALSHYYMAKEIAAILNLKSKLYKKEKVDTVLLDNLDIENNNKEYKQKESISNNKEINNEEAIKEKIININIENKDACKVFEIVRIEGVDNRPSPEWLRNRMESIGQKAINAIVDIANYVQFAMNKPMHAYDNENIKGGFVIRMAKSGETLLTLDKKELELDTETLIIADSDKPLGLAGIKGGMYSGINENTKVILLESANFDPVLIRKTSKKYNIRTDASKRFEAGQSDTLVHDGMEMAVSLYREIFGSNIKASSAFKVQGSTQVSNGKVINNVENENIKIINKIELTIDNINEALGFDYKDADIRKAIEAYDFVYIIKKDEINVDKEKEFIKYIINIPPERVDFKIKEDMIEEIGRVLGYDTLIPTLPNLNRIGHYNDSLYTEMKIREYMSSMGYDEIMNYSLRNSGDFEDGKKVYLESNGAPIALRTNISDGLIESFHRNLNNAPLMHLNVIRAYEIGAVFSSKKINNSIADKNKNEYKSFVEYRSLAIICDDNKKKTNYKNELDFLIKGLAIKLGVEEIKYERKSDKPAVLEINLIDIYEQFKNNKSILDNKKFEIINNKESQDKTKGIIDLGINHSKEFKYKHLSMYPIITRDVSVYYNESQSVGSLLEIIGKLANIGQGENKSYAQTYYLVDNFERALDDGTVKRSAAFRIVYQADDRTLTDEEVNMEVDKVYQALKVVGCELR